MSLACQVAQGRRSPCSTSVPSGSRRTMTRSRRELMRSRPSGSQPRPAGSPSKATSTRRSPSGETEKTAWSKKSEYQSRPSCQRGHSPKNRPETNGSAVRVSLVTLRTSTPGGYPALQFSTAGTRCGGGPPGVPWARDVLGAQGDPHPGLLRPVAREGRGTGEHPQARARRPGGQPPVLLRLLLHSVGGPAQGDVPGQGGVLRLVEDGVVLPGRRADPDPPRRRERVGAGARHGAQRRAREGQHPRLVSGGHPQPRPLRPQGADGRHEVVTRMRCAR